MGVRWKQEPYYYSFMTCNFYIHHDYLGPIQGVPQFLLLLLPLSFSPCPRSSELLPICKSFIYLFPYLCFALCTLSYSNEKCPMIFKFVCMIYFTQHYIFQVHSFSYECLEFILLFSRVVFCYQRYCIFLGIALFLSTFGS